MRHHVVGDDDVRALALGPQTSREFGIEELGQRRDSQGIGRGRLFGAGSMPSTGIPASTKLRRKYPSFEATSTTRLPGPSPRSATSRRACSAEWRTRPVEKDEK